MPVENFLSAIDQIKALTTPSSTTVVFTGGEALLRKDIERCGMELYKRGFPWGIVTNAFLLDANRLHTLLDSGLHGITISLDGLRDEHNWLRGNDFCFNRAIHALDLLASTPGLPFDVVTAVNQRNFNSLNKFKEFLIAIGVKNWRIFTIFPIGRAAENAELQLNNLQYKALLDFIKESRLESKIHLSYGCEGFLGNYESEVRDSFFFCHSGIHTLSILADGAITGCPNLRDNFVQGNIYLDNLAEVWKNKFTEMRNREWTKIGICADCASFRYCEGNSLHLRDPKDNSLFFCHLKRISNK